MFALVVRSLEGAGEYLLMQELDVFSGLCEACPANSVSPAGAEGESSCTCRAGSLSTPVSDRVPSTLRERAVVVEPKRAQLAALAGRNTTLVDLKTGGTGWRLVRFLPPTSTTWYSGNDNLVGTAVRGTAYNYVSEWSTLFGEFDEFCFSTSNFRYWLQCTKTAAIGVSGATPYGEAGRNVMRSSANANPHTVTFYHRSGVLVDPIISVSSYQTDLLYLENGASATGTLMQVDGGMNVWVRSSGNKPAVSPTGGPGGGGMLTFDRTQAQFLDGGARTFNIQSNGGFTLVAVVKFTGAVAAFERIIEFSDNAGEPSCSNLEWGNRI